MPREIYVFHRVEKKLARAIAFHQRFGLTAGAKIEIDAALKITKGIHGGFDPAADILTFPKDFRHSREILDYVTEVTGCKTDIYFRQHISARLMTLANADAARYARACAAKKAAAESNT